MVHNFYFSSIWKLLIAILCWLALGGQLYLLVRNSPGNGLTYAGAVARFFHFFTILSNLLVALSISLPLLVPRSRPALFFVQPAVLAAITLYIVVVGLVYNVLLRNTWSPQGFQKLIDEVLHVIVPLMYLVYWFLLVPRGHLKSFQPLLWLVFPAGYLGYVLLRGYWEGFYPYPFVDVQKLGYLVVIRNSLLMLVVFLVLGYLIYGLDSLSATGLKRKSKKR